MAVLDVELGLPGPAGVIARRDSPAGWMTVSEGGAGRPNVLSNTRQIVTYRRRTERIHDDDRLALPVDSFVEQRALVVGALDLERLVAGEVVGLSQ